MLGKQLRGSLIFFDFIILNAIFFLQFHNLFEGSKSVQFYSFMILYNLWWIIISKLFTLYKNLAFMNSVKQYSLFYKAFIVFCLLTLFRLDSSFHNLKMLSRHFILHYSVYTVLCGTLMIAVRICYFISRRRIRKQMANMYDTVIIGKNSFTKKLENSELLDSIGVHRIYNIHPRKLENLTDEQISSLKTKLNINNITNIILCDDAVDRIKFDKIIDTATRHMVRLYIIPDINGLDINNTNLVSFNGVPMIKSFSEPLEEKGNRIYKRIFDVVFSLTVLIFILSWLYPILAILIKLEDPGPVLFRQKRSGYLNREFYCLKFRSMKVNHEADIKIAYKNDTRITKTGRFLRKTSIDELPQFFNVLVGDMSVVGPRPHMVFQTNLYSELVKKYMIRHFTKPGITGWAQVMGSRGEIRDISDMEQRVEKDIWYIRHWSLMLDFKIVFLTIMNIIKGDKQAY